MYTHCKTIKAFLYQPASDGTVDTITTVDISSSLPADARYLDYANNAGQAVEIYIGAAGSEQLLFVLPYAVSGGRFPIWLPRGARISFKAAAGTLTSGYLILNLFN